MAPIRILIVDDSITIRAMLEFVLGDHRDISLVGVAADAASALHMIKVHRPDVVTLDVAMPGIDGLGLLDQIVAEGKTQAIMLSGHAEAADDAFLRGAHGFFDKSRILSDAKLLVAMLRKAAAGKTVPYCPQRTEMPAQA
jgi:chemotaxis response regulator CheB